MTLTPAMIDSMTIQLRALFEHDETIPTEVRESGNVFLDKLDAWSERMKKEEVAK
jgi:hypothetical protein